ncbi:uncharacterized protein LOC132255858 [Phlebotomus argentipes]|uniref:uncharacterized protein LOC132255858 n=1 Tax=Phlebotomus argentipes TaxID=94469 RepID=UPI002893517B|nr:uncharacterized protein LOC132255858 [Phlebotomus argentipes]
MKTQKKSNFSLKSEHTSCERKKGNPAGEHKSKNKLKSTQVNYVVNPRKLKFLTNKRAVEEKHQLIREAKEKKRKDIDKKRSEKIQRNRQLSQKTKRGQPVMKNQIEFLLKKIQSNLSQ